MLTLFNTAPILHTLSITSPPWLSEMPETSEALLLNYCLTNKKQQWGLMRHELKARAASLSPDLIWFICLFCVGNCLQCSLNWFCITELQSDKYNQWTIIRQTQLLSFAAIVEWSSVYTPARKYEGMQFTGICCPSVLVWHQGFLSFEIYRLRIESE